MSNAIKMTLEMEKKLKAFLNKNKKADLLSAYLHYLELLFDVSPVIFTGNKTIYKSKDSAIEILDEENGIMKETEIKISYEKGAVNENTKKIYICPFSSKVFGDNTHPNPQDAIYEWVSKCAQNTERSGGVRSKRFFVSYDPNVIKNYISKDTKTVNKKVYSSPRNGKIYSSKEKLLEDFCNSYIKPISLVDVQNQSKYHIHADLMELLTEHIQEDKLSAFVDASSSSNELKQFVHMWVEE